MDAAAFCSGKGLADTLLADIKISKPARAARKIDRRVTIGSLGIEVFILALVALNSISIKKFCHFSFPAIFPARVIEV